MQARQRFNGFRKPLSNQRASCILYHMWKETIEKGKEVIKEGDLEADYFYVVNTGNFEVSKLPDSSSAEKAAARGNSIATCGPGTSFGELALLYFSARAATIAATADSTVFVLARQQFKEIITKAQTDIAGNHLSRKSRRARTPCMSRRCMRGWRGR